jgi:hypothetical protein
VEVFCVTFVTPRRAVACEFSNIISVRGAGKGLAATSAGKTLWWTSRNASADNCHNNSTNLCPQHVARDETRELLRGNAPCASSSLISPCTICSSRGHRDMKRSFLVQVGLLAAAFKSSDALRKRFLKRPQED